MSGEPPKSGLSASDPKADISQPDFISYSAQQSGIISAPATCPNTSSELNNDRTRKNWLFG